MKIFAVESSATAASAAILEDNMLVGQFIIHTRLTHSQTLIPMMDSLLKTTELSWKDIELLSVATGPGSFTGIRIGVSSVKGIAFSTDLPCVGVSTLEAMAYQLAHMENMLLCCVMDARRDQVYNALFSANRGSLTRLCEDRALSIDDLMQELKDKHSSIMLIGDGALLCYKAMEGKIEDLLIAPPQLRMQSAVGVAMAAQEAAKNGDTVTGGQLIPTYLRLPQAERERLKKLESI